MKMLRAVTVLLAALFIAQGISNSDLLAQDAQIQPSKSLMVANSSQIYNVQDKEFVSLADVLSNLEQYFDVTFLFKDELVANKYVDINKIQVGEKTGKELSRIINELGLTFGRVDEQTYVLLSQPSAVKEEEFVQEEVSGTVTDAESGETLPGVNILVKGTSTGTSTDANGEYELTVPSLQDTLIVTYIGYQSQEVPINGRTELNITLTSEAIIGDELVVVGFGQQRKSNLTGSVSDINYEDIENKSISRASQVLAGEISGVTVQQTSGNPTNNEANIRIRGLGTFSQAGNDPLVIIDGIAGNFDDVNPNDIKSISVLKDAASAAIYGSRAANGVILIETKTGVEDSFSVDYNSYIGMQKPSEKVQYVDSWTYAELENEALTNEGESISHTQEEIEKFRSGEDPENYPNTRRYDELIKSGTPVQTNHNLRFSGGTANNRYSLSLGYLKNNGLIQENSLDRYNIRLNLNSDISEKFNLDLNLSTHNAKEVDKLSNLLGLAIKLPPTLVGRKSDGTYGHIGDQEVLATMDSESFNIDKDFYYSGNINLDYHLLENLKITGRAGYRNTLFQNRSFNARIPLDENYIKGPSNLTVTRGEDNFLTLQSLIEYSQTYQNHDITILGGYSQEEAVFSWDQTYRDEFPNNELHQINAGAQGNMRASGSENAWGLKSLFARLNYSYMGKYLFEINSRYDGSSRFPEGKRYELFPSFSAGWRVSEEDFFNISWIEDLKIRGSWGKLGNQEIGYYPYQQTLNLDHSYVFGNQIYPGAAADILPNREIGWEITKITDFGVDVTVWNGRVSLVADYFVKETEDILYNISSSSVLGLQPSEQNAGLVVNKGFDFQISHSNSFGDFSYKISPNFSIVNNEVRSLANVKRDIGQGLFIGESIQSIYGYVADGLFVDESDIENYPDQPYAAKPGYIRLKDINGPDGVPDGRVDPEYDRKIIGNEFPKYNFGARLFANYKNIDFAILLQGVGELNEIVRENAGLAFMEGSPPQEWMVENRWTQENPNRNARYPRLERTSEGHPHTYESTYFLRDATYLRVKNLQVGYSLPTSINDRLNINRLRIYFDAINLIAFDNYYEGWDPEMRGYYPPTTSYNIGVNVSF